MSRLARYGLFLTLVPLWVHSADITVRDVFQLEPDPEFGVISTNFILTADRDDILSGSLTGANTIVEITLQATGGPLSAFIDGAAYQFDQNVFAAFPVVDSGCDMYCWVETDFEGSGTSFLHTTNDAAVPTLGFSTNGTQLIVSFPTLPLADMAFNVDENEQICFDDVDAAVAADVNNNGVVELGDQLLLTRHLQRKALLNCSEASRANIYPQGTVDFVVDMSLICSSCSCSYCCCTKQ